MGWILLVMAIVLEVVGMTNMKLSEDFSKPVPSHPEGDRTPQAPHPARDPRRRLLHRA